MLLFVGPRSGYAWDIVREMSTSWCDGRIVAWRYIYAGYSHNISQRTIHQSHASIRRFEIELLQSDQIWRMIVSQQAVILGLRSKRAREPLCDGSIQACTGFYEGRWVVLAYMWDSVNGPGLCK
jgi:hypothetical protein